ncbi:50S ribosomal protein L18 [Candidatus Berkelbacteria bacterium]|nr:50S ribosomal protein L18 [Candidatus Berkelbacteria bacterium]
MTQTAIRTSRIRRIRERIQGTSVRPRLSIERTSRHFRAQLIDDAAGTTLLAAGDHELAKPATGIAQAAGVGELLGQRAKAAKITAVVFDRRGYRYHGRVAAFADAVRAAGVTL